MRSTPAWNESAASSGNGSGSGVSMGTFKVKVNTAIRKIYIRGVNVHSSSPSSLYLHVKNVTQNKFFVTPKPTIADYSGNSTTRTALELIFDFTNVEMSANANDVIAYCISDKANLLEDNAPGITSGAYAPFWDSKTTNSIIEGIANMNVGGGGSPKVYLDRVKPDGSYVSAPNNSNNVAIEYDPPEWPKKFTNAGATLQVGPTQAALNTEYSGTNLQGKVSLWKQGIQVWNVPVDGIYEITTIGAAGGYGNSGTFRGGKGALVKGRVKLLKGETLAILVGQKGQDNNSSISGGGGGGTYVWKLYSADPLLVAGGGGGSSSVSNYNAPDDGKAGTNSGNGGSSRTASPGYSGNGSEGSSCSGSSPGAGWYESSFPYRNGGWGSAAIKALDGGIGATQRNSGSHGGFGGGGAGAYGGGGGGGYTGGGSDCGSPSYAAGGGGGSFVISTATDVERIAGSSLATGHGSVIISLVDENKPPASPASFTKQPATNQVNLSGETVSIGWTASTDPEGDSNITYEVSFFDGTSWTSVGKSISALSFDYKLGSMNTLKAQFKVIASDSKGAESTALMGNIFRVSSKLVLIEDGAKLKTIKNGSILQM